MAARVRVCFAGRDDGPVAGLADELGSRPDFAASFETTASAVVDAAAADCVVSARALADGDGIEALEAVREHHPGLPFLLVAADGSERVASRAISAGVTDYVPADAPDATPDAVAATIRDAVTTGTTPTDATTDTTPTDATPETGDATDSGPAESLAVEAAGDGIAVHDADGRFVFLNLAYADMYGYERDALLGTHWSVLFPDDEVERVREAVLPAVSECGTWSGDTTGVRRDDSTFTVHQSIAATDDGGLVCVARDVTERRRRERRLAALNDLTQRLLESTTDDTIAALVVDTVTDGVFDAAAVACYDGDTGELAVAERAGGLDDAVLDVDAPGGTAFAQRDVVTADAADYGVDGVLAAAPLGDHGVVVLATEATREFSDAERDYVDALAATVEAALDRADRERLLQDREETLAEQNETLERLNRVNDIIRSIDQGLVSANSRSEIEDVVCRHLGDRGPYEFAWVGEPTPDGDVAVRASHGNEKGYLDAITVTTGDEDTGRGPGGRAVRTREPQVVNDILTDSSFRPWRQEALNRGYRASATFPLEYEERLYGILNVYATEPNAFTELERSVLADLSETVAYAINAAERKRELATDRVTELEFELGANDGVVARVRELGAEVTVENVVHGDDSLRAFVSAGGVTADAVREYAPRVDAIADVSVVASSGDPPQCLFEAALTDDSLYARALEHGGVVQEVELTGDDHTATVWLPGDADVREFVETFTRLYPDAELVSKRDRDRGVDTRSGFRARVESELTDRQLEAVQTAYFSGFSESPRRRTGTELADSLGVSQPTFNTHLRAAHRKLMALLFDTDRLPDLDA